MPSTPRSAPVRSRTWAIVLNARTTVAQSSRGSAIVSRLVGSLKRLAELVLEGKEMRQLGECGRLLGAALCEPGDGATQRFRSHRRAGSPRTGTARAPRASARRRGPIPERLEQVDRALQACLGALLVGVELSRAPGTVEQIGPRAVVLGHSAARSNARCASAPSASDSERWPASASVSQAAARILGASAASGSAAAASRKCAASTSASSGASSPHVSCRWRAAARWRLLRSLRDRGAVGGRPQQPLEKVVLAALR